MGSADTFARIIGSGDIYGLQNLIGRFGYPTAYSAIKYLLGSHDQIFNKWFYDAPRNHPALRSDIPPLFPHFDAQNRVLAFQRWNNAGDVILIVVNLSDNQWNDPIYGVNVGGSGDRWTEIFNSQAPQYGGWPDSGNYLADLRVDTDGQLRIRVPQWSVLMLQKN